MMHQINARGKCRDGREAFGPNAADHPDAPLQLSNRESYFSGARRYILSHGKQHPSRLGKEEIEAFLTHLAVDRHVAPSAQNQALNGVLCLYRHVLEMGVPWLDDFVRASPRKRVPVVLDPDEVRAILGLLRTRHDRIFRLLYGSGLRINEALRLRVKDIAFGRREPGDL